ncbi:hypothetical protein [Alkalihalobacterium alkalinitrilicum]|uniref:hypothetical protein n=1 Tax=Alkalihalobacterium alkalinitrilicum TaxID=427920 RepID=UPI000AA58131|nr:hypothetical protein [Alkalihalobacterium alkalinitrilicum]
MCQTEKYRHVWFLYLENCEKYGVESKLDFYQFINSMTLDQMEQWFEQSQQVV